MNNKFDELTKSMAQSVTRRTALKKFGVGRAGLLWVDEQGAGRRRQARLVRTNRYLLLPKLQNAPALKRSEPCYLLRAVPIRMRVLMSPNSHLQKGKL